MKHFIIYSSLLLGLLACSESSFNETTGPGEVETINGSDDLVVGEEPSCIEGDRINLNFRQKFKAVSIRIRSLTSPQNLALPCPRLALSVTSMQWGLL